MIKDLLKFNALLEKFRDVERRVVLASGRRENDAEHSYMIAMLALHIRNQWYTELDLEKILLYALVHDLVEVYAGDTYAFAAQEEKATKHDREEASFMQLMQEFPENDIMWTAIKEYEERSTREAKFIYALDKLHPILIAYQNKDYTFKDYELSLEDVKREKSGKISADPVINEIYTELLAILEREQDDIFA